MPYIYLLILHFNDREAEAQRSFASLPVIIQLVNDEAEANYVSSET